MFSLRPAPRTGRLSRRPHRSIGAVTIRPIRPTDAPLVADAFDRLSDTSRHNRFLGGKTALSPAELHHLTVVDHRDHEALIAISTADGRAVGVARYIRLPDGDRRAEIAVTVVDEWQRRGLGRVLVNRLADHARIQGVGAFSALIADHNEGALALLGRIGRWAEVVESEFGITEYAFDLNDFHRELGTHRVRLRAG